MIDIKGLDKAAVLAALYNGAHPMGMGFMHFDPKPWTTEDAQREMVLGDDRVRMFGGKPSFYFDYLKGRIMKVNIGGDQFDEALYDRDNGHGAAERAIAALRENTVAAE